MEESSSNSINKANLDQAVQTYLEHKVGKKISLSQIEKLIEIEHRRKDPLLHLKRLHYSMPTFITISVVGSFLYIVTLVFKEVSVVDGLKVLAGFLGDLPTGVWALLTTIFGFWFAGKAGSEVIETWKRSNEHDS